MHGWVNVGCMGCSSLAAHMSNIYPSKYTFHTSQSLTATCHPGYNEPFLCQNFKTIYTLVPQGEGDNDKDNERVTALYSICCGHIKTIMVCVHYVRHSFFSHLCKCIYQVKCRECLVIYKSDGKTLFLRLS